VNEEALPSGASHLKNKQTNFFTTSIIIDCPRKNLLASQKVLVFFRCLLVFEMLRIIGNFDVSYSINDPVNYN
jgi:hypothetical protein